MNRTPHTFDWDAIHNLIGEAVFADDVDWAESIQPPTDPTEFAREVIFVICNSGMKNTVARVIFDRVMGAIERGVPSRYEFGHAGKCGAIDYVWRERVRLLREFLEKDSDEARLAWLVTLPWIGPITKYHLAKNFGMQVAKPDVHLSRLAATLGTTPQELCEVGARATGWKVATVDTLLWRAAALGRLDTRTGGFR